jgi:hypothetical protein
VTGASRNRRVTHMMNIDWSNRAPPGPARPIRPAHRSIRAARQTCPAPARARRDGARRVAHWAAGQAVGCGGTEKPATRIRVGLQARIRPVSRARIRPLSDFHGSESTDTDLELDGKPGCSRILS